MEGFEIRDGILTRCTLPERTISVPQGVRHIGAHVMQCPGRWVTLPETVETIQPWAFSGTRLLETIALPRSLRDIGDFAFMDSHIGKIQIPGSVKVIGTAAFLGSNLQTAALEAGIRYIGRQAFARCRELEEIIIPESVECMGREAFCGSRLKKIKMPARFANLLGTDVFAGCNLEQVELTPPDLGMEADCVVEDGVLVRYLGSATQLVIPGSIRVIGEHAFAGCDSLQGVYMRKGVEKIRYGAFSNCYNLRWVDIPGTVENIDDFAFSGCGSLTGLNLFQGVRRICRSAFDGCWHLERVQLPDSIQWIDREAFRSCPHIRLTDKHGIDCTGRYLK